MRERCKLRHHRRHARNATNELTLYRHTYSFASASEMTYIVSSGALNSTHSPYSFA